MTRDELALVRRAKEFARNVPSGLTRAEMARLVFKAHPGLSKILRPSLQAKWVWEQRRAEKDAAQLPLVGLFGETVFRREDWREEQYRAMARRYDHAARENLKKRDLLLAEYERKFHQQLELWQT